MHVLEYAVLQHTVNIARNVITLLNVIALLRYNLRTAQHFTLDAHFP